MCSQNTGSNDNISENIRKAALAKYEAHLVLMGALGALIERSKKSFTPKNPVAPIKPSGSHRATPSF